MNDPLAYGPNGIRCGCGKDAHSNLVPCQPDQPLPDHHIGRSWTTHEIEDGCPCVKAPCGLVVQREVTKDCQQHHWSGAKSIRQSHPADACPGSVPVPDRPYTDDDLRTEAARQISAHRPDAHPEQTYAAMLDARIESTRDTDGPTWSEALDASELNAPALAIHALIEDAADTSRWAVDLGADGLEPSDEHVITLGADDKPIARIHFAFEPGMPEEMRTALVEGIGQAMSAYL